MKNILIIVVAVIALVIINFPMEKEANLKAQAVSKREEIGGDDGGSGGTYSPDAFLSPKAKGIYVQITDWRGQVDPVKLADYLSKLK